MGQFLGFGNGSDGIVTLSGTDAPIDASCSGTAAATSLAATNASFVAGQMILILQMRGTGVGQWEINKIASYVAGTITLVNPLAYTYTDSGNSQAQVLVLKQYSSVTISGTLTAKAWDGNVGGIIAFLCNGKVSITGTVTATGKGFLGATSCTSGNGWPGEGSVGTVSAYQSTPNGSGGGGAGERTNGASGGGGAGHSATGTTGQQIADDPPGQGGLASALADLTEMTFGGGGGKGGNAGSGACNGGNGGNGGGIIFILAKTIDNSGGSVVANGSNGTTTGDNNCGGGGAGGGGSIYLVGETVTLDSALMTALGGSGGGGAGGGGAGGASATGRIRVIGCTVNGTTNPSANESEGGQSFCSAGMNIL